MGTKLQINYAEATSELEKVLKKFNLKRKVYKLLYNGRGLEFEQFREFTDDDSGDSIDWNASLRANKPLVKQYIEEKDIKFYFVIDISSGMLFGSENKLKAEHVAELALSLSNLILVNNDPVGMVAFNGGVEEYLPPRNDRKQVAYMESILCDIDRYKKSKNISKAMEFMFNILKEKKSVIILISDFLSLPKDIERELNYLITKGEVIAIAVRDPMDLQLPKTKDPLVLGNPETGEALVVDTEIAEKAYSAFVQKKIDSVRNIFRTRGIDFLELTTNESFILPLVQFLEKRITGGESGLLG